MIWTRLAPRPLADDGLGGMPAAPLPGQLAGRARRAVHRLVRTGAVDRRPGGGARRARRGGRPRSPAGSTSTGSGSGRRARESDAALTAPAPGAPVARWHGLRLVRELPAGYFTAYRQLAEERPDLVLHLGDYLYEGAGATRAGRTHVGGRRP